jgi:hypothetical protein
MTALFVCVVNQVVSDATNAVCVNRLESGQQVPTLIKNYENPMGAVIKGFAQ